jgi:hypothetical protein
MPCEACQKLLTSDSDAPHDGLLTCRNPSILRPFGRPPVVLHRYRCRHCGFNWIREIDPLERDRSEWICLYQASNILVPATEDCPSLSSAGEHSSASGDTEKHTARPGALAPTFLLIAHGRAGKKARFRAQDSSLSETDPCHRHGVSDSRRLGCQGRTCQCGTRSDDDGECKAASMQRLLHALP